MSRAASPARRPSKSRAKAKGYFPDRFFGVLLVLVDLLGTGLGALMLFAGLKAKGLPLPAALFGGLLLLFALLSLIVHVGLFRGRRWAFVATAFLSVLPLGGSASNPALPATGLFMLVYAILRLIPAFGPKPS